MWEAVETSSRKIRMEKVKGGRSKERNRKETRGKRKEKAEERKNGRDQKSSRRVGDLE